VQRLRTIGDKRGSHTNTWITRHPGLLESFRRTIKVPLRVVHVTRNPYDNIASLTRFAGREVDTVIDRFALRCDQTESVRALLRPDEILDVRYELFLQDPRSGLSELCHFIGVEPTTQYLEDCASVIWSRESKTRSRVSWTAEQIERVNKIITTYPAYSGYSFDN
jgi:hypothetical protein